MIYVYIESEPSLFKVGFYGPDAKWHHDSEHTERELAAYRVHYLNGGGIKKTDGNEIKTHPDLAIQIDVKEVKDTHVVCNLYTGVYCAQILMGRGDYEYLIHKGFFIRDGKTKDGADMINTTDVYNLIIKSKNL